MTQLEAARKGIITPEMKKVLQNECLSERELLNGIISGKIVVPKNINHEFSDIKAIGEKCFTKINTNLGTSELCDNEKYELKKLEVAIKYGTDAVMDLSTGGDLKSMRLKIIENSPVPVGTVPIYQVAVKLIKKGKDITDMTPEMLFEVIEENGKDGVDFITVHCGITKDTVEKIDKGYYSRLMPSVSRGGALLMKWIRYHKKENPLYEYYDELLKIAKKYDMTLSLGDGLRPGCIADATDRAQISELVILGELHFRAVQNGVQAMIEGPGHVPLSEVKANVLLEKKLCNGAPFYVLGPVVTDIAPGYDHITAAIGGAIAGSAGADFLCYVTPAEHLRLPDLDDVKEGVIASKIAAHVADLEKGLKVAWQWDYEMAKAREKLDWDKMFELAIDPDKAKRYRNLNGINTDACSMCGKLCSVKQSARGEK